MNLLRSFQSSGFDATILTPDWLSAKVRFDAQIEDQFSRGAARRASPRRPHTAIASSSTNSAWRSGPADCWPILRLLARFLADQLGLSRGVVVEAYEQLVAEGYHQPARRHDARVAANVDPSTPRARLARSTGSRSRGSTSRTAGRT